MAAGLTKLSRPRGAWWLVGPMALIAAAYTVGQTAAFQYDDVHSIVENAHIRSLRALPDLLTDPASFSADPRSAMYRPLVLLSYAANYALSEYRPAGYRALNLLLHLANVVLVYALARRFLGGDSAAAVAAVLFGLHPVNVETTVYISSRSESLCALFLLAALYAYVRGADAYVRGADAYVRGADAYVRGADAYVRGADAYVRGVRGAGPGAGWLAASLLCFAASLLSKSVGVVLLGVLVLHELTRGVRLGEALQHVVRRQWPYWLLAGAYVAHSRSLLAAAVLEHPVRPWLTQVATQMKAMVYYLQLVTMPVRLNVEHQFRLSTGPGEGPVLLAAVLTVSAAVAGWILFRTRREPLFWLACLPLFLLPSTLVPLNVLVNEHRLYLPTVAFAMLVAQPLSNLGRHGRPAVLLGAAWLLTASVLVNQRGRVWGSEESLWRDSLSKAPLMPRPHIHVGDARRRRGEYQAALEHYQRALTVYPGQLSGSDRLVAHNNMGATYLAMGRLVDAMQAYQAALRIDSTYARARDSLDGLVALRAEGESNPIATRLRKQGMALMIAGRLPEARAAIEESLSLASDPQAWMALALVHERSGDAAMAESTYRLLARAAAGTPYAATAEARIESLARRSGDE